MDSIRLGRWDWLLLSVAIATLSGLLHWLVHHLATSYSANPARGAHWRGILHIIESPWFLQPLQLVYAIGLPAVAFLWQGALTSRGLGLKPLPFGPDAEAVDWAQATIGPAGGTTSWTDDVGWFSLILVATAVVVALGIWRAGNGTALASRGHRSLSQAAIDAVVYEIHWAFYREPFVVTWGVALGSWLGAVPALVEGTVNLMFWERLRAGDRDYVRAMLIRGGLLVASSQLFLKTQNLWLAIIMDLLVGWLLLRRREPQSVSRAAITTIR
ncbi:MAG: hypothetical protein JXC32_07915 [Anaerolineae bacterium]|nr:hypothetical protein [Anaerolineae bacterium]